MLLLKATSKMLSHDRTARDATLDTPRHVYTTALLDDVRERMPHISQDPYGLTAGGYIIEHSLTYNDLALL
jgi:hypothetical protein